VPPVIATLGDKATYLAQSALSTRLTSVGNALDRCGISLPCSEPGALPVGISLIGAHGADRELLAVAQGVEALLPK
jgi:aspartyl-tRNA(Asn)/glutamyl-tRNA(Gln) amidotransferase subunit A